MWTWDINHYKMVYNTHMEAHIHADVNTRVCECNLRQPQMCMLHLKEEIKTVTSQKNHRYVFGTYAVQCGKNPNENDKLLSVSVFKSI